MEAWVAAGGFRRWIVWMMSRTVFVVGGSGSFRTAHPGMFFNTCSCIHAYFLKGGRTVNNFLWKGYCAITFSFGRIVRVCIRLVGGFIRLSEYNKIWGAADFERELIVS